jgi:hypothetical protein
MLLLLPAQVGATFNDVAHNVACAAARALGAATARALDSAADLSFSDFSAIRASIHVHDAALSDSLCKTKARVAPTVHMDCNTGCDHVIDVDVAMDVDVGVDLDLMYGREGGSETSTRYWEVQV